MNEARCPWPGCPCTHDRGCFKGWLDPDPDVGGPVKPCPICRDELAARLRQAR